MKIFFARTFAIALVLILSATGLWAAGSEEEPAAAAEKEYVTDPSTGKQVLKPAYGGTLTAILFSYPVDHGDTFLFHGAGLVAGPALDKLGIAD